MTGVAKTYLIEYGKYADKTFQWVRDNDIKYFLNNVPKFHRFYSKQKITYYQACLKQHKNKGLFTSEKNLSKVHEILSLMKKGKVTSEIRDIFNEAHPESAKIFSMVSSSARKLLIKEFEQEKKHLIDQHILRYDSIYKSKLKDIETRVKAISPQFRFAFLDGEYSTALDSLQAKEKLLGLHTKTFKLEINNYFEKKQTLNKPEFDFTKLTLTEKIELRELIRKLKNEFNSYTIVDDQEEDNNFIEDAVIIKEEAPINKVIVTSRPDIGESENTISNSRNIKDYTHKVESKTIIDVSESLREATRKKAEELFNKKKKI
jgi:hypothetical protein